MADDEIGQNSPGIKTCTAVHCTNILLTRHFPALWPQDVAQDFFASVRVFEACAIGRSLPFSLEASVERFKGRIVCQLITSFLRI